MTKQLLVFVSALLSFTLMSFSTTVDDSTEATFDYSALITLRAGTPISLSLNQEVHADEVEIGNSIEFLVRSNVTVNGQVIIAAGSIAEGMIKDVVKTCDTCKRKAACSKLVISVETAQAVDGQQVYLRSIPMTVKGNCCCNEMAIANIGKTVSARVQNDVRINA
ncbi:MAG: hypothetical protein AAF738_04500 [Bacteroidota bacterium]